MARATSNATKANLKQCVAWHIAHAKRCACRPIPPKLAALIQTNLPTLQKESQSIRISLSGGDRPSIAQSHRVPGIVRVKSRRVSELVLLQKMWLVAMRAMDLIEKLAHEHPEWFIKARTLDSLATLSQHDASLRPIVLRCIQEFEQSQQ